MKASWICKTLTRKADMGVNLPLIVKGFYQWREYSRTTGKRLEIKDRNLGFGNLIYVSCTMRSAGTSKDTCVHTVTTHENYLRQTAKSGGETGSSTNRNGYADSTIKIISNFPRQPKSQDHVPEAHLVGRNQSLTRKQRSSGTSGKNRRSPIYLKNCPFQLSKVASYIRQHQDFTTSWLLSV